MGPFLVAFAVVLMTLQGDDSATRTWTSSDGKFTTEAELLDFQDGQAHLRKADGQVIRVPMIALSKDDRDYLKSMLPGIEEPQVRPGVEVREWTSRGGSFTTMAEYLDHESGNVHLRKLDGEEIVVPLTALSDGDRAWIQNELQRRREQPTATRDDSAETEESLEALGSQTIPLRVVKLEPGWGQRRRANPIADYYLSLTQAQHFRIQPGQALNPLESGFQRLVRREPQYQSASPLKAVIRLGSDEFAFVLDGTGKGNPGYNRLYFDFNRNGDLTDDKPIDAADTSGTPAGGVFQSRFPPVDVNLQIEGVSVEHAVLISAVSAQKPIPFASASVYSGAVREGHIQQGTSRIRLVLVDQNSNGRFDDRVSVRLVGDRVLPTQGDLLLLNPNTRNVSSADATMGRDRHFVSRTVCIGRHFYELEVSPAGDQLTLTPKDVAIGFVTNPNPGYRAMAYSDDYGVVMLSGTRDAKIPLPTGQWRLANYSIDASVSPGSSRTTVTATCGGGYPPVTVEKDGTAELAFGAPFRPQVTTSQASTGRIALSLSIVGVTGERVTNLLVNGRRPPAPRFVITDSEGAVVHQGSFEYG